MGVPWKKSQPLRNILPESILDLYPVSNTSNTSVGVFCNPAPLENDSNQNIFQREVNLVGDPYPPPLVQ